MILSILSVLLSVTYHYSSPQIAEASYVERETLEVSLQDLATQIAIEEGLATSTTDKAVKKLHNLVYSESRWNPNAEGDKGCSFGLTQQNICANPHITKEQALDPEFSLRTASRDIKQGMSWKYTPCSCVLSLRAKGIPIRGDAENIVKAFENGSIPSSGPVIGGVIAFRYSSGEAHVGQLVGITKKGWYKVFWSNYKPCLTETVEIDPNDPSIVGFISIPVPAS